jgi:ribosomal protein S12
MDNETKENEKPVFDVNRYMQVALINGEKVRVHFPDDKQLMRRKEGSKVLIRTLGRRKTQTTAEQAPGLDLKILKEIRDGDTEVDEDEATRVLERICLAEVTDIQQEGAGYRVFLQVPGTVTEHLFKKPTQGQITDHYRAGASYINLPFNVREFRLSYGHAEEMYNALIQETLGYAPGSRIPILHKSVAVDAMIEQLQYDLDSDAATF